MFNLNGIIKSAILCKHTTSKYLYTYVLLKIPENNINNIIMKEAVDQIS